MTSQATSARVPDLKHAATVTATPYTKPMLWKFERHVRSVVVDVAVRSRGAVGLANLLRYCPSTRCPIDCDRGPSVAVLAAEMDQQRMGVVLDPKAVLGVLLLVQAPDDRAFLRGVGDE